MSNKDGRVSVHPKINRPVSNAGIQIALRINGLYGEKRRKDGPTRPHIRHQRGKPKGKNTTEGKAKIETSNFDFLEPSGGDPIAEEVSGNQRNIATGQVNLSDILGGDDWGEKIGPKNVLALSQPDSTEEDCAAVPGCEDT